MATSKSGSKSFNILEPWKTLDPWQKEFIEYEGNTCSCCGRQSGKSAGASIRTGKKAVKNKNFKILMIAFTEKQAYLLFFKTLMYLKAKHPGLIKGGKDKPTKHRIALKNGSEILCYAAGVSGFGLVGHTIHHLVVDEAASMAREVFVSIMPMLSVTKGTIDVISTPRGKEGFFYDCWKDPSFKNFHVSAEDCPRHSKEHLEHMKRAMSKIEYAQEYLAQFLDEVRRVFSDELIKNCCILKRPDMVAREFKHYLGCDLAGMGDDINTFEVIKRINKESLEQTESMTTKHKYTTETTNTIKVMDQSFNFKRIGIDDAGVGFGVFSELMTDNSLKRRVIGLNNASRDIDSSGEKSKRLLKVDMYMNLMALMEKGKIKLLDDDEVRASLASIQFENIIKEGVPTKLRIFGRDSHIAEGLIRATWLASKDKSLNIYIA